MYNKINQKVNQIKERLNILQEQMMNFNNDYYESKRYLNKLERKITRVRKSLYAI